MWSAAPGADWPRAARPRGRGAVRRPGGARCVCVPDRRGRRPGRRRADRGPGRGPPRRAHRRRGPGARYRDFLAVSRGAAPGRGRHPRRGLRPGARPRPGGDLGRRRRPPRRAARAVPPHPRGAAAARRAARAPRRCSAASPAPSRREYLLAHRLGPRDRAARATVLRERVAVSVAGGTDRDLSRDPHARGARLPAERPRRHPRGARATDRCWCRPRARATPPSLACERCRDAGPLPRLLRPAGAPGRPHRPPTCRWCGTEQPAWACAECGHRGLRAPVLGDARTAEELGRAFPAVPVRSRPAATGCSPPSTPGRRSWWRPRAPSRSPTAGYAAVVLLDTWLMLARADLRTAEEALRRWLNAAALVRPGGRARGRRRPGPPRAAGAGALGPGRLRRARDRRARSRRTCRRRPGWRRSPASPGAVDDALTLLAPPGGAEVLGPVPVGARTTRAVRSSGCRAAQGAALSRAPRRAAAGPLGPQARRRCGSRSTRVALG